MHPHLAADVSENLMPIVEFNPEEGIGERFDNRTLDLDGTVFLGHILRASLLRLACLPDKPAWYRPAPSGVFLCLLHCCLLHCCTAVCCSACSVRTVSSPLVRAYGPRPAAAAGRNSADANLMGGLLVADGH